MEAGGVAMVGRMAWVKGGERMEAAAEQAAEARAAVAVQVRGNRAA